MHKKRKEKRIIKIRIRKLEKSNRTKQSGDMSRKENKSLASNFQVQLFFKATWVVEMDISKGNSRHLFIRLCSL